MIPLEIEDLGCGRGPGLKGTKLNLYTLIPARLAGNTPEDIAERFRVPYPDLTAAHIELLFSYMDDHYDEVMAVHHEIQARIDRGNPPWVEEQFRQNLPRLLARLPPELRARTEALFAEPAKAGRAAPVEPPPLGQPVEG
ncbi:MAG: hypothetical protein K2X87_34950 [Gemmataceae bacterium]|nr:hypothetical protein [Gemmataceae bacterium]